MFVEVLKHFQQKNMKLFLLFLGLSRIIDNYTNLIYQVKHYCGFCTIKNIFLLQKYLPVYMFFFCKPRLENFDF